VAFIGTSSGPDWAAICREPKPNLSAASNNFLEVADNFLDFETVSHLTRHLFGSMLQRMEGLPLLAG
jgi:hypothetical protein